METVEGKHKNYLKKSIFKNRLIIILDDKYEEVMFKKMQQVTVPKEYFGDLDGEFFDADQVVFNCLKDFFGN